MAEPPLDTQLIAALRHASRALGIASVIVGLACLAGIALDLDLLTQWIPRHPSIPLNTALCCVLAGTSLWIQAARPSSSLALFFARSCAAIVAVVGTATLIEYAVGLDLGMDRWIVHLLPRRGGTQYAVRPLPLAALELALVGPALLLLGSETNWKSTLVEIFGFGASVVALVAVTAHIYGATTIYQFSGSFAGIALPASTLFVFLSTGILLAYPERGLLSILTSDALGGATARRLVVVGLLSPLLIGLLVAVTRYAGLTDLPTAFAIFAVSADVLGVVLILFNSRKLTESDLALRYARSEETRLRKRVETLYRASEAVAQSLTRLPEADVRVVLQAVVLQARAITDAQYAALGIGDDPEKPFNPWVQSGMTDAEAAAIGRVPRPVASLGEVVRHGKALRMANLEALPAFRGFPPHHPKITSLLGVPIRYEGNNVGNLYLGNKLGASEFSEDDQRAVEMLATRVGASLEIARLYQTEALTKKWLGRVIDQMPEGLILTDDQGRILSYNRSARSMAAEALDQTLPDGAPALRFDISRPSGQPVEWEDLPLIQAIRERRTVTGIEINLRKPDGRQVTVLASAAPVSGRETLARGASAVIVCHDVTELKELERLREEWTAVIAHDLRQPASTIAMIGDMLSRPDLTADREPLIKHLRSASQRLDRMIGDLLDMSRIEARKVVVHKERMDLVSFAKEVIQRSSAVVGGHQVKLESEAPALPIFADPARVEQILFNLLSNAAKYGDPGSDILIILKDRINEAEVSVVNRGEGIGPEDLSRLFTRFYRTPGAKASRAEGLGLGLYIAKGLVDAQGGMIWVESKPKETTAIRFTLPYEESAARETK